MTGIGASVPTLQERADRVLRQHGAIVRKAGEETPGDLIRDLLAETERQRHVIEAVEAMLRTVHRNGAAPMDVLVAVEAMLQNEQRVPR